MESNASVMKGKVKGKVKRKVGHLVSLVFACFFPSPFNYGKREQVVVATSVECLELTWLGIA